MPISTPRDSTIAVVGDGFGSLIVYATAVVPRLPSARDHDLRAERQSGQDVPAVRVWVSEPCRSRPRYSLEAFVPNAWKFSALATASAATISAVPLTNERACYGFQRPFFEASGRLREVQAAVSAKIIRLSGKHRAKSSGRMGLRHGEWTSGSWMASVFNRVIATDASEKQFANALSHERVDYRVAPAANSGSD